MTVPGGWQTEDSIWQLVECCAYTADLIAWTELCAGRSVLDLGCGIGRVGHHLARAGCEVTGIERDSLMATDFNRLAPPGAKALPGDVLDPDLSPGEFDAVIAPQQLIQILGDEGNRQRLLKLMARSLRSGGIAALAVTTSLPFESSRPALTPDIREIEGWVYSSRPVGLEAESSQVTVERLRERVDPSGNLIGSSNRISFSRLDPESLEPEFEAAGLVLELETVIPATEAHVGSSILILRH